MVRRTRGEDPVTVEGVPEEEGLDTADAVERTKLDPEEQKNFTETHPGSDAEQNI